MLLLSRTQLPPSPLSEEVVIKTRGRGGGAAFPLDEEIEEFLRRNSDNPSQGLETRKNPREGKTFTFHPGCRLVEKEGLFSFSVRAPVSTAKPIERPTRPGSPPRSLLAGSHASNGSNAADGGGDGIT